MGSLFAYDSPLWRTTDRILRFLWLSILWGICCIPIITIGASTTALYSVSLKYVKNQESYLTSSFFRALKANFRQGTIIWAIFSVLGLFFLSGLIYYFRREPTGPFFTILMTASFSMFLAFQLTNLFVYPLLAAFEHDTKSIMFNAGVLALTHLPSGILMLSISFFILIFGAMIFPPLLFVAPAMTAYINSYFFNKIFSCCKCSTAGKEAVK